MATDDVEFVAILTLRYMEPHLMGLAHDWVEQNAPEEIPGARRNAERRDQPEPAVRRLAVDIKAV